MVLHLPATDGQASDFAATGPAPTMSSREIADLCEARHNDVIETVRRLFEKGVLRESRKTTRPHQPAGGGRPTEVYDLTKRDTLVVVSGYNDVVRARIIDRWMELEAGPPAIPRDYPAALRQLAASIETVEQQQRVIAEQQPKADAFDKFMNAKGVFGYQNAGRVLGCRPNLFVKWLKQDYLFYRGSALLPYAPFVEQGLFIIRTTTGTDDKVHERGFVTPKGLNHLSTRFPRHLLSAPLAESAGAAAAELIEHLSTRGRRLS